MDPYSRAIALRMIGRELEIQEASAAPSKRFGLGLIEAFYALGLITEPEYCSNIRLLSSLVEDRKACLQTLRPVAPKEIAWLSQ